MNQNPHGAVLLSAATELVRRVWRFDQPADALTSAFFREHRSLGSRDRTALVEALYNLLRKRRLYEHLASLGAGPLERRLAILAFLPDAVSALGAGLTANEQQWLSQCEGIDLQTLPEALRHNLPDWLADALQAQLGAEFRALARALLQGADVNLRVNTLKQRRDAVQSALLAEGVIAAPTPYSPWGLRIDGRPSLGRLDLTLRGEIEVQDEGSQLLALLTDARREQLVVDYCAGAGGKTLALGACMRNTGRLYALDTSAARLESLRPRLARSGLKNVYPMAISGEQDERVARMAGKADRVLVDAPCSGLGTLRRSPDLKWRQAPGEVQRLTQVQARILESAARLVKRGGSLVYATCSLLVEENEAIAQAFSATHPDFRVMDVADLLHAAKVPHADVLCSTVEGIRYLRLWPHRHGTDGFFAAMWRKS